MFAQGLFQAGYRDKAAAIYGSLLLGDADRVQQAELLRRCLRSAPPARLPLASSHWDFRCSALACPALLARACGHACQSAPCPPLPGPRSCWTDGSDASAADEYVFSKLVALFEGRPGALGWEIAGSTIGRG